MSGMLEMKGFQENFPSMFSQMFTNSTTQTCSIGSDDSTALVVSVFWASSHGLVVMFVCFGCRVCSSP